MSEECKYCKTSQTCLEMADYGSIYCLLHREIPRVIEKTYEELQQENQELKKQLEIKETQQKEFIKYLEDKLNICDGFLDTIKSDLEEISYAGRASGKTYIATQIMKNETAKKCYEEALSKYKEIIKDERI